MSATVGVINGLIVGTMLAQRMLLVVEQLRPLLKELQEKEKDVDPEVLKAAMDSLEDEIRKGYALHSASRSSHG